MIRKQKTKNHLRLCPLYARSGERMGGRGTTCLFVFIFIINTTRGLVSFPLLLCYHNNTLEYLSQVCFVLLFLMFCVDHWQGKYLENVMSTHALGMFGVWTAGRNCCGLKIRSSNFGRKIEILMSFINKWNMRGLTYICRIVQKAFYNWRRFRRSPIPRRDLEIWISSKVSCIYLRYAAMYIE